MRALYLDITQGKTQGASTIDQQLIRSTFLTPDKTLKRKIKEIVLAIELDRRYSKNQILEWYLNQVPFGINIYGAEEASLTYFQNQSKILVCQRQRCSPQLFKCQAIILLMEITGIN